MVLASWVCGCALFPFPSLFSSRRRSMHSLACGRVERVDDRDFLTFFFFKNLTDLFVVNVFDRSTLRELRYHSVGVKTNQGRIRFVDDAMEVG